MPQKDQSAPRSTVANQTREIIETVVVVLILVSLLRIFGAEAFEIPSGSMATTLLGAHKAFTCPECGYRSLVNARAEVEGDDAGIGQRNHTPVRSACCQNCGRRVETTAISPSSGDRVLVAKYWYDGVSEPQRWQIPVFKCPEEHNGMKNYIKRLVGLPGETIRIWYGRLLTASKGSREFVVARRPPNVMLAVRRLVHDADFPPRDLRNEGIVRWSADSPNWTSQSDGKVWTFDGSGSGALIYEHRVGFGRLGGASQPSLITDIEAYNTENSSIGSYSEVVRKANWVRDLMVECRVDVGALAGSIAWELVAGARRFRLVVDLQSAEVAVYEGERKLASAPSGIKAPGEFSVRFADFDDRLTVWLNNRLAFGDGVDVAPSVAAQMGPFLDDFRPCRIVADRAKAAIRGLKLFRNAYYLQTSGEPDTVSRDAFRRTDTVSAAQTKPTEASVAELRNALLERMQEPLELTVEDESYLMMGDNSPQSFDGRDWRKTHFVHRKMLLGRALSVYWPLTNWKFVR